MSGQGTGAILRARGRYWKEGRRDYPWPPFDNHWSPLTTLDHPLATLDHHSTTLDHHSTTPDHPLTTLDHPLTIVDHPWSPQCSFLESRDEIDFFLLYSLFSFYLNSFILKRRDIWNLPVSGFHTFWLWSWWKHLSYRAIQSTLTNEFIKETKGHRTNYSYHM